MSGTAMNWPLTGRNIRREEEVYIGDCTVRNETGKDEERMCKGKSVSEQSV
jgi:hypothetical protein